MRLSRKIQNVLFILGACMVVPVYAYSHTQHARIYLTWEDHPIAVIATFASIALGYILIGLAMFTRQQK